MKKTIPNLKKGQVVQAKVIESVGPNDFIVDFHGDLIRVRNHTPKPMIPNQMVKLTVFSLNPLTFQVRSQSKQSSLNVRV